MSGIQHSHTHDDEDDDGDDDDQYSVYVPWNDDSSDIHVLTSVSIRWPFCLSSSSFLSLFAQQVRDVRKDGAYGSARGIELDG